MLKFILVKTILKKKKTLIIIAFYLIIFLTSLILNIHNATLYNPKHGFDGIDHLSYILYLNKNWQLPSTALLKETHQSPLYYFIGAVLIKLFGTWKASQYINVFVFWLIIGVISLTLWRVFKKMKSVLVGAFSLIALPMLNIFPPMLTNELLNTLWIICCFSVLVFLCYAEKKQQISKLLGLFFLFLLIGYWTKVSILLVVPIFFISFIILLIKNKKIFLFIILSTTIFSIISVILMTPIYKRAHERYSGSDITTNFIKSKVTIRKDYQFFYRLDWIWKVDMYNTQYYSMIGAAWNSFWTDGHNAITPFIKFHKKSFVLWSLGFVLLPICLYGLILLNRKNKGISLVVNLMGIFMLLIYICYNLNNHYSAARLTYETGIIVPYAFGMASASENKKIKRLLLFLLSIQFVVMVSFFWIQPWWHVTK